MDEERGLVHTVKATPANEHDVTVMSELLHGEEERAYGDSGYIGANKRPEAIEKNKNGKNQIHYKQTSVIHQKVIKEWSVCH